MFSSCIVCQLYSKALEKGCSDPTKFCERKTVVIKGICMKRALFLSKWVCKI